jgi:hypothetical protein
MGVDGIQTDYPDQLLDYFKDASAKELPKANAPSE